jgi:hypothetical protein
MSFTAQPKAPAFVLAGASGWAVNRRAQDVTKWCQSLWATGQARWRMEVRGVHDHAFTISRIT